MAKKEELIWVDKETAKRYSEIENDTDKLIMINDYIEGVKNATKEEYQASLDSMNEDAVMYSGLLIQVRKEFEKVKNEALSSFYGLWEEYDKDKSNVIKKVDDINASLDPLLKNIESINRQIGSIDIYKFEKLFEFICRFNRMSDETKAVLKFLIDNFGK